MASDKRYDNCLICLEPFKRFGGGNVGCLGKKNEFSTSSTAEGGDEIVEGEEERSKGCQDDWQEDEEENLTTTSGSSSDERKDLYMRFLRFLKNYLKMRKATERLFLGVAGEGIRVQPFCDVCYKRIEVICDLYEQLEVIQLQLKWRLEGLGDLMVEGNLSVLNKKLRRKLFTVISKRLGENVPGIEVNFMRRALQLKCKTATKKSPPKVLVHRGLFPDYWKFTLSKTKEMLIRLLVVYTLGAYKFPSMKPSKTPPTSGAAKPPSKQNNSRCKGPRSRQKKQPPPPPPSKEVTAVPSTASSVVEINTTDKIPSIATVGGDAAISIKVEAIEDAVTAAGAFEEDDPMDDEPNSPPDYLDNNDGDSDWSGGGNDAAGSPMSVAGQDSDASIPPEIKQEKPSQRRWNLRGNRRSVKIESDSEADEDNEPEADNHDDNDYQSDSDSDQDNQKKRVKGTGRIPTLKCPQCPMLVKDTRGLSAHLRHIHKTLMDFKCKTCGMIFKIREELVIHRRQAHKTARSRPVLKIPCTHCTVVFPSQRSMQAHRRVAHKGAKINDRGHECPHCFKMFYGELAITNHLNRHETNTLLDDREHWICQVCATIFYTEETLQAHMSQIHSDKFGCSVCDATLDSGVLLRDHLMTTHEEADKKRFGCQICLRRFTTKQFFNLHRKLAHNQSYLCDHDKCNELFKSVGELNEHLKVHLTSGQGGEGQEEDGGVDRIEFCKTCELGFLSKYRLTLHQLLHTPRHSDKRGYQCPECGKDVLALTSLISHYNMLHGEKIEGYKCMYCDKGYTHRRCFKEHLRRHEKDRKSGKEFECDKCGLKCWDSILLIEHKRVEHPPPPKKERVKREPREPGRRIRRRKPRPPQPKKDKDPDKGPKRKPGGQKGVLKLVNIPCKVGDCEEICANMEALFEHLQQVHEEGAPEKNVYCCYCHESFAFSRTRDIHGRRRHKKNIPLRFGKYCCDVESCVEEPFTTIEDLNEHLKSHLEGGREIQHCVKCSWGFLSAPLLRLHELVHIRPENGRYKCSECHLDYDHRKALQFHFNSAHGTNLEINRCEMLSCERTFFCKAYLNSHVKTHIRKPKKRVEGEDENERKMDGSLICSDCGKLYPTRKMLNRHQNTMHNRGTEYKCDAEGCGMTFLTRKTLYHHRKVMHGDGPQWVCEICAMPFVYKYRLESHMAVHREKQWTCEICGAKFGREYVMRGHMEKQHGGQREKSHVCSECGKGFLSTDGLRYHFLSAHASESEWKYECPGCGKKFYRKLLLDGHKKTCAAVPKVEGEVGGGGRGGGGWSAPKPRKRRRIAGRMKEEEEMSDKSTTEDEDDTKPPTNYQAGASSSSRAGNYSGGDGAQWMGGGGDAFQQAFPQLQFQQFR